MFRWLFILGLLAATLPAPAAAADCEFKLGFKELRDKIPGMVGSCRDDEHFNTANGNAEQRTSAHHGQGGLLVWRKADNWTAFTDGHWTWINGPFGVQRRLNSGPLFDWEAPAPAQENAAPVVNSPGGAAGAPSAGWARHDDPEKSFDRPADWTAATLGPFNLYLSPDREARITYLAPFKMGGEAKAVDFLGRIVQQIAKDDAFELGAHRATTINGHAADVLVYGIKGRVPVIGLIAAIQHGSYVHVIDVGATAENWSRYENDLVRVVDSYVPKTA
jgi:hypothetical protein